MRVTPVFLRVLRYRAILINAWGRSSAGRTPPALQVDNTKRCAFMHLPQVAGKRCAQNNELSFDSPRIAVRGPIGGCWSINPSRSAFRTPEGVSLRSGRGCPGRDGGPGAVPAPELSALGGLLRSPEGRSPCAGTPEPSPTRPNASRARLSARRLRPP